MLVIGFTGGIGTGKSTVAYMLKQLGACIIDADRAGHRLYRAYSPVWRKVVAVFGRGVLGSGDRIDRCRLGVLVFNDPGARAKLNSIMHPRMYRNFMNQIARFRKRGEKVVVLDAAVLVEAGWAPLADEIWVVYATLEQVVQRLRKQGKLSDEEITKRIGSQLSFEELAHQSHVVIENSGSLDQLRKKVDQLWNSRVKGRIC